MKRTLIKVLTALLTILFVTASATNVTFAKSSDLCAKPGCNAKKYCGSYCAAHDSCKIKSACKTANYGGRKICKKSGCGNTATYTDGYCGRHTSGKSSSSYSTSKSSTKSSSSYKKSSSSKKKSYSMPDCDDYEDFDDFMDDWDGCMPDDSNAEDYWDNW